MLLDSIRPTDSSVSLCSQTKIYALFYICNEFLKNTKRFTVTRAKLIIKRYTVNGMHVENTQVRFSTMKYQQNEFTDEPSNRLIQWNDEDLTFKWTD